MKAYINRTNTAIIVEPHDGKFVGVNSEGKQYEAVNPRENRDVAGWRRLQVAPKRDSLAQSERDKLNAALDDWKRIAKSNADQLTVVRTALAEEEREHENTADALSDKATALKDAQAKIASLEATLRRVRSDLADAEACCGCENGLHEMLHRSEVDGVRAGARVELDRLRAECEKAQASVSYWREQHEIMGDDRDRWKVKYEREKQLATTFCEQNRDVLAERDRWKAECEKAQAEAKRFRSAADTDRESARRWEANCRKAIVERDEARAALAAAQEARREESAAYEKALADRDEALAEVERLRSELFSANNIAHHWKSQWERALEEAQAAVDPDPTSASRLQLAIETLDKLSEPDADGKGCSHWSARDLQRIEREAEAAAAREQERDAEIEAVMKVHSWIPTVDIAAELIDTLDAHRAKEAEK
jgi:chromosome segregation ATPase